MTSTSTSDSVTIGVAGVPTYFTLIRSKDAGPFMLTIDLFFVDAAAFAAFTDAKIFTAERIGGIYGVDPADVASYEMPDILAIKISFPRRISSGDFLDTDITGGQQYGPVVDLIAELEVEPATTDRPLRVRIA